MVATTLVRQIFGGDKPTDLEADMNQPPLAVALCMLSSILFPFGQFTPKITAIAAMAEILFSAFDSSTTKRHKK